MRNKILITSLILLSLFFNYSIFKNEDHITNGRTVYFELAPVDPRSLLQGDYMVLNYDIADKLHKFYEDSDKIPEETDRGKLVLELDENDKANLLYQFETGMELKNNQILLDYSYKNQFSNKVALTTSYFFEEGSAELFEEAKYGVFKYKDDKFILIALADENYKIIKAQ